MIFYILNAVPLSSFLNEFFSSTNGVPFIGIMFYAMFSFYLLLAVFKGLSYLGMRIVFIVIHPLRYGSPY
jgi:LMBR1 domain-containing protein 1